MISRFRSLWLQARWLLGAAQEYRRRRSRVAQQIRRERARFYDRVWREAADRLGADVRALTGEILEIACDTAQTRVRWNETAADDPVTLRLAGDKPAVHRLLTAAGVPVPRHVEFSLHDLSRARRFLAEAGRACVVKPARSTGAGQGITTGIATPRQLVRAALQAAVYGRDLLIEEQIPGDNYRLLFLDGELLDAVVRRPPGVVGDGRSTVAQLIRHTNRQRAQRGFEAAQTALTGDADMRRTLARQGLSLRSVPAAGTRVVVKTVINDNGADENEPAADRVGPAVVESARRAAAALGVRLAGVDVVTTDPERPLQRTGGVVLEVNTTPGLYYHYHRRGGACPVAIPILRALLGLRDDRSALDTATDADLQTLPAFDTPTELRL